MAIPAPFAFGYAGRWLTSTHEREVFICDGQDDHTVHIVEFGSDVTGVRNTATDVLAVDEAGLLSAIDPVTGQRRWDTYIDQGVSALAATDGGRWAVVLPDRVTWGEGPEIRGRYDVPQARFVAFDPRGELAIATADGRLLTVVPGQPLGPERALGFPATGLAHSRLGWWLVSTTRGVFRAPVDGGEPQLYLEWGGEAPPHGVTCSENGRLCAFVTEGKVVVLFGVERDANCGAIIYADREVGELEFGPGGWLGVGLGRGDGNKIDLVGGGCHRTDPPPDRVRNRWMLQLGFDPQEVAGELGPLTPPKPAAPSGPRVEWGKTEAEPGSAPPTAGMLVYALGLLGVTAFLAWSASAGWYDDPFLAWLGAGILGVSGISILVASLRK